MHSTPHVGLVYHAILSIYYLMEEVRVLSAALLPSHSPPLPRSPHRGKLANRRQRPRAALLRILPPSRVWVPSLGTSEPGSRPCLAPYPKQAGNKIGMGEEDSPEGKGRGSLTHHPLRAGTGSKNNSTPPRRAPPLSLASSSHLQ